MESIYWSCKKTPNCISKQQYHFAFPPKVNESSCCSTSSSAFGFISALHFAHSNRYLFANKGLSSQGYGFSSSHIWMLELDYKESWVPTNWCFWTVVLEKTLEESLGLKEISPGVHWKDWYWSWNSNTLVTWWEELTHLKRPWCWERLRAVGEGDDRGWDGWMASLTQWTWVWVNCVGDGQGGLACCSSWGRKKSDTTERLNWTEHTVLYS